MTSPFSRPGRSLTRPSSLLSPLIVLGALLGASLAPAPAARAQNMLSSYSLDGTVAAGTASYDYRYTKHTLSTGGRGSHTYTYCTWDPYLDQTTTTAPPLLFGVAQQAMSNGTFYSPTYSATAKAQMSLTNTPTQAVLQANYGGATTMTTVLAAHQSVVVTAQPGGTFTFTITANANVSVSTTGSSGGVFRLFGSGTGVLLGPLSGTSGPVLLDTPLSPGTYWVTSGLTYTSGKNTQAGTTTNPGTSSTAWGFTLTITPEASGTGD